MACAFVKALVLSVICLVAPGAWSQSSEITKPVGGMSDRSYLMYVGTYTKGESKGIYVFRYDGSTGRLTGLGLAGESENPSFLAVDPSHRFLYAVNELTRYKGAASGAVSAFRIDHGSGKLTLMNQVPSGGADPCYLSFDKTGKFLLVANYTGGNVSVFRVAMDGSLGESTAFVQHVGKGVNPERQEGAHAHWMETTADNRFALAVDLGLDEVVIYRFDATRGTLAPNDPPFVKLDPGAGPRHVAFTPDGKFAYSVNELQSTITAFAYDSAAGALHAMQTVSTLPKDFSGKNDTAEIHVHPSGRFVYASNRGDDSIALFTVDKASGRLTPAGHFATQGKTPRNFEIDPSGSHLLVANQDSGNIVVFEIDPASGRLTPTGQVVAVPSPVSILFVPNT
jgi:6-phosphogluconolactonase